MYYNGYNFNNEFNQRAEGCYDSCRTYKGRELMPMVTYSDLFTFVIMLCAVITLVYTITHKK